MSYDRDEHEIRRIGRQQITDALGPNWAIGGPYRRDLLDAGGAPHQLPSMPTPDPFTQREEWLRHTANWPRQTPSKQQAELERLLRKQDEPKEVPFDQSMRRTAFDGYFAAVMGMSLHPGTTRDLPQHRTPEECRDIALQMLKLRDELVAQGVL